MTQITQEAIDVNALAQEIRRVDGNHSLGAGALAEALIPFLSTLPIAGEAPEGWQLVPVKMTADMINAWSGGVTVTSDAVAYQTSFQDAWKRVLAASPSSPGKDGGQEVEAKRVSLDDALVERLEIAEDALTQIANAFTAHTYSDAMDAVQALKDIAKEALNAKR